jgi:hypothetical protein
LLLLNKNKTKQRVTLSKFPPLLVVGDLPLYLAETDNVVVEEFHNIAATDILKENKKKNQTSLNLLPHDLIKLRFEKKVSKLRLKNMPLAIATGSATSNSVFLKIQKRNKAGR